MSKMAFKLKVGNYCFELRLSFNKGSHELVTNLGEVGTEF